MLCSIYEGDERFKEVSSVEFQYRVCRYSLLVTFTL